MDSTAALVHVQKTVQSDGGGATHLLNAQVSPCVPYILVAYTARVP